MPNAYTTLYVLMAGISITLGVVHVRASLHPDGDKTNLLFGLWGLSLGPFYLMGTGMNNAANLSEYVFYTKAMATFGVIQHPCFAWFIAYYTGYRNKIFLWALSALFLLLGIVNVLSPYSILYGQITDMTTMTFLGEEITHAVGPPSVWTNLAALAILFILPFGLYAGYQQFKRGDRKVAKNFLFIFSLFLLAYFQDIVLVMVVKFTMPSTTDFVPMIFMILMSNRLTRTLLQHIEVKKELVNNERRWRTLLEHVELVVIGVDRENIVTYVNPYYLTLTGFERDQVLRHNWLSDFVPEREAQRIREAFAQEFHSHFCNAILTRSGEERVIAWSNVALYDREGQLSGILTVGKDMTEQLQSEQALKSAYEEVEALKNQLQEENLSLQEAISLSHQFQEIIGESKVLNYVLTRVEQVATSDTMVFLDGETGVGKELFAQAIHQHSARKDRPLITINCAAIPPNLIESELFGHEKGAFTGADKQRKGRFEIADGGTLFLDEIGELPLELQPKLLRVLQEGEFERIGDHRTRKANARIITATNRNLKQEVEDGRFREDLYYRLRVYPISIPSLRQRVDDIPLLVNAFVRGYARKHDRQIDQIPPRTLEMLQQYHWPGNVRELQNVIERAVITSQGPTLHIPESFLESTLAKSEQQDRPKNGQIEMTRLQDIEYQHILRILNRCAWQIDGQKGAALLLGLHPNTLRSRMKKLGIKRPT